MKRFGRLYLLIGALALGGFLGSRLLPAGPLGVTAFLLACFVLGEVFHWLDKQSKK